MSGAPTYLDRATCENCAGQGGTDAGATVCEACLGTGVTCSAFRARIAELEAALRQRDGQVTEEMAVSMEQFARGLMHLAGHGQYVDTTGDFYDGGQPKDQPAWMSKLPEAERLHVLHERVFGTALRYARGGRT